MLISVFLESNNCKEPTEYKEFRKQSDNDNAFRNGLRIKGYRLAKDSDYSGTLSQNNYSNDKKTELTNAEKEFVDSFKKKRLNQTKRNPVLAHLRYRYGKRTIKALIRRLNKFGNRGI